MADFRAIAAISKTIEQVLKEVRNQAEFATAQVGLAKITDFKESPPMQEGISIYLYRVDASNQLRNRRLPPDSQGNRPLPPLPLDLHYLITAWGQTVEKQQHLLGWCMRTLENTPTLHASLLNHHHPGSDDVFKNEE